MTSENLLILFENISRTFKMISWIKVKNSLDLESETL